MYRYPLPQYFNHRACNSGDDDTFVASVKEIKRTQKPTAQMYGSAVVALVERHVAEIQALRKIHSGQLEASTSESNNINTLFGRPADFDQIVKLINQSSVTADERCNLQVCLLFEDPSRRNDLIFISRHKSSPCGGKRSYGIAICVTSSLNILKRMQSGCTL